MKLVVVDDDSLVCSALSRCLVRLGHSSRMATSVEGALTLIAAESPAAVLTDLDLGRGGDGIQLIGRLRAAGLGVPVLMMTGGDPAVARARLETAGLDEIAVLEKPFEFEDLLRKLAGLLPADYFPQPAPPPARGRGRGTPVSVAAIMGTVVGTIGGRVI